MAILTAILGESGTGKSASMRNLVPEETMLIQSIRKPLPFRSAGWKLIDKKGGNIAVTDRASQIITIMQKTKRDIIIIDDFQYVMANEFMRRSNEKSFDKFTEIGRQAWDILNCASLLPDNKRVYFLSHTETDNNGHTKLKTIGRMLDEKITVEGMFTIVLKTIVSDGCYQFSTQNNGYDTVKSPMGLFSSTYIENDIKSADDLICEYYGINKGVKQ